MLRRIQFASSSASPCVASIFCPAASSVVSARRSCHTKQPGGPVHPAAAAAPTDLTPQQRARMERLAKMRAEEESSQPPTRHFERSRFGAVPPPNAIPPHLAAEKDSGAAHASSRSSPSGRSSATAAAAAAAAPSRSSAGAPQQQQPAADEPTRHIERTMGKRGRAMEGAAPQQPPQTTRGSMPEPKSSSTAGTTTASSATSFAAAASSATQQQQQQRQQQELEQDGGETAASPGHSGGGSSVMFNVPEGELPKQHGEYDPWKILGLKAGASAHDLRVRYHELLEQFHPDYVKDGEEGDVQKWADIDRAYQLVTKAPTLDRKYRRLVTDAEQWYYAYFPEWLSRNIDEMPRWWTWVRWRFGRPGFWIFALSAAFIIGKLHARRPKLASLCFVAVILDIMFHTAIFPVMFGVVCVGTFFTGSEYNLAWLTSPRQFLRRPLQY